MNTRRHTEIDLLRTIAIVMMVIYHTAYDLDAFYNWNIHLAGTGWETFRIITASLFLILSGISSQFSLRPLRRSLIVLSCAMIITIVTYMYDPHTYIRFGILHCIGTGMLCLIALKKLKEFNILLGLIILILPVKFPPPHITLDYYPLLPWFGLMLIGAGIGHYFYIRKKMMMDLNIPTILQTPGKHALIIYMMHQPIILALLYTLHITH